MVTHPSPVAIGLAIPTLSIALLAFLSSGNSHISSVTNLLAILTIVSVLFAWKSSTHQQMRRELPDKANEASTKRKPAPTIVLASTVLWPLSLIALWLFQIPQLLPTWCATWMIRRELAFTFGHQPKTTVRPGAFHALKQVLTVSLTVYLSISTILFLAQRSLLFVPSQTDQTSLLAPWLHNGETVGYCREVSSPQTVWLMTHGNAGQAADRSYVLPHLSSTDAFYVLEYPGYGKRPGVPSRTTLNQAAADAYQLIRRQPPSARVCVIGESIGSGPAATLTTQTRPPDKIILVVPFDSLTNVVARRSLTNVVARRFPWLPVQFLLLDQWDNAQALKHYRGPVEVYGALDDQVIPINHARRLAMEVLGARLIEMPGGHNDWSLQKDVYFE